MNPKRQFLDERWRVVVGIANAGSLSKAALEAGAAQSQLSRQLAALEAECGARLFQRTGRGVVPTEFGQRVLPRVRALLDSAQRLDDAVQSAQGVPMGEVRVGLLPAAVPWLAAALHSAVRAAYPLVRLHLSEGASTQLAEMLGSGRLDLALMLLDGTDHMEGSTVLRRIALHLIGQAGQPLLRQTQLAFDRLDGLPLVLPAPPHPLRARLARVAGQRGVRLHVVAEADSIALQREIAGTGDCFAIGAGIGLDQPIRPGSARLGSTRLVAPVLWRHIVLSSPDERPDTLAIRKVKVLLGQLARQQMPTEPA